MKDYQMDFIIFCVGGFGVFVLAAACVYCLLVADVAYQHHQRGYTWIESIIAGIQEYN